MRLEVEAQIQRWLPQRLFGAEQKGDQQSPKTPVAIPKRMDGFELDVSEGSLEERWCSLGNVVDELLERTHALRDELCRRRDENGIPKVCPAQADQVASVPTGL